MVKCIKSRRVGFDIVPQIGFSRTKDRVCENHAFVVVDMAKGAKPSNPKTWGSKAVIVDAWTGQSKPAHEMILEYESIFDIDKKTEALKFMNRDVFT